MNCLTACYKCCFLDFRAVGGFSLRDWRPHVPAIAFIDNDVYFEIYCDFHLWQSQQPTCSTQMLGGGYTAESANVVGRREKCRWLLELPYRSSGGVANERHKEVHDREASGIFH